MASSVLHAFARLPRKGKPAPAEWTVLAGIALLAPGAPPRPVAIGSGTKCLSAEKMSADGEALNDSHAEVDAGQPAAPDGDRWSAGEPFAGSCWLSFARARRVRCCSPGPVRQDHRTS